MLKARFYAAHDFKSLDALVRRVHVGIDAGANGCGAGVRVRLSARTGTTAFATVVAVGFVTPGEEWCEATYLRSGAAAMIDKLKLVYVTESVHAGDQSAWQKAPVTTDESERAASERTEATWWKTHKPLMSASVAAVR